jgi:hypothetical protein
MAKTAGERRLRQYQDLIRELGAYRIAVLCISILSNTSTTSCIDQRLSAPDQSLPTRKNAYLSESEELFERERTGSDEL